MKLTPREKDKPPIFTAALLAKRPKTRGLKPDLQVAEFAGVGHAQALASEDQIRAARIPVRA